MFSIHTHRRRGILPRIGDETLNCNTSSSSCVNPMKVKYFHDTDTALVEFSEREVTETKEINENIYIDLDAFGNLVAMTIEHAHQQASLPDLSYE